jgi:hypothetical protein
MNATSVPIFYSIESLSTRLLDYSNVYLMPAICLFGIFTNLVNILVTYRSTNVQRNDHIITYILINSILDLVMFSTQIFTIVIRCGTLCPYGYTFAAKVYEIVFYSFVRSFLVTAQAMFILHMTVENLKLFYKNSRNSCLTVAMNYHDRVNLKYLMAGVFVGSAMINSLSNIIPREVGAYGVYWTNRTNEQLLYERRYKSEWRSSSLLQALLTLIFVIRIPLLYTLIGVGNGFVAVKFHRFLKNKQKMAKQRVPSIYRFENSC